MKEFKVTVTSGYKKIYYVEADDWEQAEEIASITTNKPDQEEYLRDEIDAEEMNDAVEDFRLIFEPKENKRIVLNDKLIASIDGKLSDRYYRAVLIKGGWFNDDEYAPNGNPDLISVEQQLGTDRWGPTGGHWYVETLMGRCEDSNRDEPTDSIYIDGGQGWKIESGMLDALNAYEQLKSEASK